MCGQQRMQLCKKLSGRCEDVFWSVPCHTGSESIGPSRPKSTLGARSQMPARPPYHEVIQNVIMYLTVPYLLVLLC